MSPTKAQLAALRLAARDAIQYHTGGWYTIGAEFSKRMFPERTIDEGEMVYTTPQTLRACVARGWLVEGDDGNAWEQPIIYSARWTLTDLGRAVLDAATAPARDEVDDYHRAMARRERAGQEPGFVGYRGKGAK